MYLSFALSLLWLRGVVHGSVHLEDWRINFTEEVDLNCSLQIWLSHRMLFCWHLESFLFVNCLNLKYKEPLLNMKCHFLISDLVLPIKHSICSNVTATISYYCFVILEMRMSWRRGVRLDSVPFCSRWNSSRWSTHVVKSLCHLAICLVLLFWLAICNCQYRIEIIA